METVVLVVTTVRAVLVEMTVVRVETVVLAAMTGVLEAHVVTAAAMQRLRTMSRTMNLKCSRLCLKLNIYAVFINDGDRCVYN